MLDHQCFLRLILFSCLAGVIVVAGSGDAFAQPRGIRDNLEVEDLGSPVSRRNMARPIFYRALHSGHYHFFMQLAATDGLGDDPEVLFLDVNLDTGEIRSAMSGANNRPGRAFLHPNGMLYVTGSRPNVLIEFNPETAEARFVGLHTENFYHATQCIALGPDGNLYFGHYGRHATKYNPETDEMTDFGPIDGAANNYLYNIASDGRYIYCRMSNGWYLAVYDMETGETETFHDIRGNFRRDREGYLYWGNHLLVDGKLVAREDADEAREIAAPLTIEIPEQMDPRIAERDLDFEFDLSNVQPSRWNNGLVIFRWRRGEEGEWREAVYEGLDVIPNVPNEMAATPEGKLVGQGSHYGPIFLFDPETRESERVGDDPGNAYRILATEDTIYFASYRSQFWVYERGKPWKKGENPVNIVGPGIRPNLIALDAEGRVYVAGNHGRHRAGGDLKIYDPETGEQISMREEMEPYSISDMIALEGGERVVWSAIRREDRTVHFFVYNAMDREVRDVLEVELRSPGFMMALDESRVIGAARVTDQDEEGNDIEETYIYRLNIDTGDVDFENTIPGRAFNGPDVWDYRALDSELVKGPDGCGWLFIDNNLTRIHPDGTAETVKEMDHGARIIFIGDDMYLYGGGRRNWGGFSQVWRISDVFE